jgi:hypothetical protein
MLMDRKATNKQSATADDEVVHGHVIAGHALLFINNGKSFELD